MSRQHGPPRLAVTDRFTSSACRDASVRHPRPSPQGARMRRRIEIREGMRPMNRRDFLKAAGLSAATAAFLRNSLARAVALPAIRRSGTIEDVEHVVIFMQENRSF